MKTNPRNPARRFPVALIAAAVTLLASPVTSVFAQSFPQYPLQTGGGVAEPNIMFILDDSGSMANTGMTNPDIPTVCRRSGTSCASPSNTISSQSYPSNTVYYNPATTYAPWMTATGNPMTVGTAFNSVYGSFNMAGPGYAGGESDTIDLGDSGSCQQYDNNGSDTDVCGGVQVFHVPKDPSSTSTTYLYNSANYYRYELHRVSGTLYTVRAELTSNGGLGAALPMTTATNFYNNVDDDDTLDYYYTLPATGSITASTATGTGNVRLRLYNPSGTVVCDSNGPTNTESCTATNVVAGSWRVRLSTTTSFDNTDLTVNYSQQNRIGCGTTGTWAWGNCTLDALPNVARNKAAEFVNYATWYSYHRTRMKLAKAGAADAFNDLGDNVRVGYRTIWNRSNYDIPINDGNSGLFESTARTTWYSRLLAAKGNSGTPLHGALQDTGEYFSDNSSANNPYGPGTGEDLLACRQNFAILTTDGFWNNFTNYNTADVGDEDGTAGVDVYNPETDADEGTYAVEHPYRDGDSDSDNQSDTLADVAMDFWKNDLVDLENFVPVSDANPAFWQHMVTFGISIGLKGTVDQTSVSQVIDDGRPRKAGVAVDWPNPNDTENSERIDDLLHAAVNGHGEFIAATNAEAFSSALQEVLGTIQARLASGSNVATNSTSLEDGSRIYQATFYSERWDGDLRAFDLSDTAIDADVVWSIAEEAADAGDEFVDRTVLTWDTGTSAGDEFPTAAQTTALARTTGTAQVTGARNADYIRGDQTWEASNGDSASGFVLRNRVVLIGDIINSSPFYVKVTGEFGWLFVGANDGMLHAIDAEDGTIVFSYIPAGISLSALASRSDPDYVHHFFVDGPMTVSADGVIAGKKVLVGSLGRGGKGVFGLDVSTPGSMDNGDVLWDRTATVDTDMGHVMGPVAITKANNSDEVVWVGNGIDSTDGEAVLYAFDAETGTQVAKISTGVAGGNGLSAPRPADEDQDGKADIVYAGDLLGNLWKFDVSDPNPSNWEVDFSGVPLYSATSTASVAQPITGGISLDRDEDDNVYVLFGTGRLLSNSDLTDMSVQTMYGIVDDGSGPIDSRDDLTERDIVAVGEVWIDDNGDDVQDANEMYPARAFEEFSELTAGTRGWALDLDNPEVGERVVGGTRLDGRAVWFSSITPSEGEGCEPAGDGWLNAIDLYTGTSSGDSTGGGSTSYIDLDGDGVGDLAVGEDGLPIGSINLGIGMPTDSRGVGNLVVVCGSGGACEAVQTPPGLPGTGGDPGRLSWRELVEGDE